MATVREQAISAWWYWGTEKEAAKTLGISERLFTRALEGRALGDKDLVKFKQGVLSRSESVQYTLNHGYQMVAETMSFRQADLLKTKGFDGRRFAKAVRDHERRRGKIPKGVGDFIAEVGSP